MRVSFVLEGTQDGAQPQRHFVIPTEEDDFGQETQEQAILHFQDQTSVNSLEIVPSESGLITLRVRNEDLTPETVADIQRHAEIALKAAVYETRRG